MAENKKLVNADNLQAVAKGVYDKTQQNLNTAKGDLEGQIAAHAGAKVTGKDTGAHEADQIRFETDMLIVSAQGGIKVGADLNGMSVQEVLTKLLYPHVKVVIGTPTTTPSGSTREHGNYQTVTQVTVAVTKKSNPILRVELYHNTQLIDTKSVDEGEITGGSETVTFKGLSIVTANGSKFTAKVYAKNEAGTAEEVADASATTFTYVYPFYHGVMAAGATIDGTMVTGLTKVIEGRGQKAYSYTTSQNHAVIAYPKVHGELKSILDPNNFENLAAFTKHEVKVTGLDGTEQAYYVYVSGASSVSGFKYTFKF